MKLTEAELREHIRVRLETERGSFSYDPEMGSELWRLQRSKNVRDIRRDAMRYIRQALQPEIDAGLIDSIDSIEVVEISAAGFRLGMIVRAGEKQIASQYDGITGQVIPDEVVGC